MKKLITIALTFSILFPSAFAQQKVNAKSQNINSVFQIQSSDYLTHLLLKDPSFDSSYFDVAKSELTAIADRFKQDISDTLRQVYRLYSYIQRKELRNYAEQVNFSETILNNKYDCLTGSLLIALVLDELEIPFEVMEFNYHIALTSHLNGKKLMIDATDPISGFITSDQEIEDRIAYYSSGKQIQLEANFVDISQYKNVQFVGIQELIALHYFNLSVNYYNARMMLYAKAMALKAYELYPCERHQNMLTLITDSDQILASY